jgi:hypothetical protein
MFVTFARSGSSTRTASRSAEATGSPCLIRVDQDIDLAEEPDPVPPQPADPRSGHQILPPHKEDLYAYFFGAAEAVDRRRSTSDVSVEVGSR